MVQVHSRWRSLTQTCLVLTHRALTMITHHSRCRHSRHSCLSWMVLEQARARWSSMKTLPCEVMCYLSSEMWCSLNCSAVVHIFLNQVASSSFTSIRDDKFGLFSEWKFDLWKVRMQLKSGRWMMRDRTDDILNVVIHYCWAVTDGRLPSWLTTVVPLSTLSWCGLREYHVGR